jgi:hypothetical protein
MLFLLGKKSRGHYCYKLNWDTLKINGNGEAKAKDVAGV